MLLKKKKKNKSKKKTLSTIGKDKRLNYGRKGEKQLLDFSKNAQAL